MPIYEYTCKDCQAPLEVLQKVTDEPLTRCEKCGGMLEKIWSQTSFQLKGSGWYVTDYKKNNQNGAEKEKKSEPETKADPGEKKTESAESAPKAASEPKKTATTPATSGSTATPD